MKKLLALFLALSLLIAAPAFATTRALQFSMLLGGLVDSNNKILAGGSVEFCAAGTSTPKSIWTDKAKTAPYTSRTLDSTGSVLVYGDGIYKVKVYNAAGTKIYEWDNIYIRGANYYLHTVTGTYASTTADDFLLASSDGGVVTVNLFTAADAVVPITIKRDGSNNVVIDGYVSETINGATTYTLSSDNRSVVLWSDGSNWQISETPTTYIRDIDGDTQIQVEESADEDIIRFDIGGTEQINLTDGALLPTTDNDIDLGSATYEFQDLFIDGIITADTFILSVTAGEGVGSNLNPTDTDTHSLGTNTKEWKNAYFSGVLQTDQINVGSTAGEGATNHFVPSVDNAVDLGNATYEWKDLYIDGTAEIDQLNADAANITALSIGSTLITATAAELNYLDGITSIVGELNILDGATVTAAELNQLNGATAEPIQGDSTAGLTLRQTEVIIADGAGDTIVVTLDDTSAGFNGANQAVTGVIAKGATVKNITLNGPGTQIIIASEALIHVTGTHDSATGNHNGANNLAYLWDTVQAWETNTWIGATLTNTTNSESCVVTANTATTMTCTLSGGEDWDTGDGFTIADAPFLTDSGESWVTNAFVGATLNNYTDVSACTITANTGTTITCTLAGGTDNDWDVGDVANITSSAVMAMSTVMFDDSGDCSLVRTSTLAGDIYLSFYADAATNLTDLTAAVNTATPIKIQLLYLTNY